MGGIINFPKTAGQAAGREATAPHEQASDTSGGHLSSLCGEIESMLTIIFSSVLVHYHWTGDWWWLKFSIDPRHSAAVMRKPNLVRAALERIYAFYFDQVAERFDENKPDEESGLAYLEVKQLEGCETDGRFLNVYFRTYRFAGRKKKLLKAANDPRNKCTYESFVFWDDVKPGMDEEKFRVHYLYKVD